MSYLDNKGVERLWTHITAKLGDKVNKEEGKGLSSNDFTAAEKTKLASLTAPSITSTGAGNAVTNISVSGSTFTVEKNADFLTEHPYITKYIDTSSTASPAHGETFTTVDSISRDENGHVEKINVKTVTLPEYTLAGLMSSTAKGSATLPVYWTGSAWDTITSYEGAAAKVANALSINGKTYDGSAAINADVIDIAYGGTGKTSRKEALTALLGEDVTTNLDEVLDQGKYYWGNKAGIDSAPTNYGTLISLVSTKSTHDNQSNWLTHIAIGTNNILYWRQKINGANFLPWKTILDSNNFSTYAATKNHNHDDVYLKTIPIASSTALGGVKVGSGLTIAAGGTLNHSNSITAKTAYGSAATTASADGGTITLTDVQYDAQGHITGSTDRTITLSQRATTLEELGIDTFDKLNTKYKLDDKYKIAPDWYENDSANKNYVKNRPGGYFDTSVIATTGDLTAEFEGVEDTSANTDEFTSVIYSFGDNKHSPEQTLTSIVAGQSYTVVWDGTTYSNVIAKKEKWENAIYLGEILEDDNRISYSNYPFLIVPISKHGILQVIVPSSTSARSITFSIGGYNVVQIPEQMLEFTAIKNEIENDIANIRYQDLVNTPGAYTSDELETLYLPITTASQSVTSYFQVSSSSYGSKARYYDLQADDRNYGIKYNGLDYNLPAIPVYMNADSTSYTREYDPSNCTGLYIALGNLSLLPGLESETTGNNCPIVILSQAMMDRGAITIQCAEGSTLATDTDNGRLEVSGYFVNRLVSLNVEEEVDYPNLMFDNFTFNYAVGTRFYLTSLIQDFREEIGQTLNNLDNSFVSKSGDTMTGALNIEDTDYPSFNLVPTDSTSKIKKSVFEGSLYGAVSMSAWEDDSGQNRRILEVRAKAYESSLDNALLLRVCDNDNWSDYKVFHSGTTVPITSGGTGASTAAGALENLGAAAKEHTHNYLPTTGGTVSGVLYVEPAIRSTSIGAGDGKVLMEENVNGGFYQLIGSDGTTYIIDASLSGVFKVYSNASNPPYWASFNGKTGDADTNGALHVNGHAVSVADIQIGTASVGTSGATITFPRAFAGVPVVTAVGSVPGYIRVFDVTATGFSAASGNSGSTVQWQAIYLPT